MFPIKRKKTVTLKVLVSLKHIKDWHNLDFPLYRTKVSNFHYLSPYVLWTPFFQILDAGIFHLFKPQTFRHSMENITDRREKPLA